MTEAIALDAIDPKMRAQHYRDLAQWYHNLGANLAPLGNDKRPVQVGVWQGKLKHFPWKDYQTSQQGERIWQAIRSEKYWIDVHGVAVICGFGGWVNLDIDSVAKDDPSQPPVPREIAVRFLRVLGLPQDYPWLCATPTGGWHIFLRAKSLTLSNDKGRLDQLMPDEPTVAHVELRWEGHYVALPGTLHPNGGTYKFAHMQPTAAPDWIDGALLLDAYESLTQPRPEKPKPAPRTPVRSSASTSHSAYVAKAVDDECERVAKAGQGARNDTLNSASFALGTLVGAGVLAQGEAEDRLLAAALSCGLTEGEALATIASGIDAGKQQPRELPESAMRTTSEEDWIPDLFAAEVPDHWGADSVVRIEEPPKHLTWPYAIVGNRLVLQSFDKNLDIVSKPISDFQAVSVEEIIEEEGGKVFVLEGQAVRGGFFRVEVPAEQFGDDRTLRKVLSAAAGSLDGVYAKMGEHLRPAIQKCSPSNILRTQRFRRTGWADGRFLLPGRAHPNLTLTLDSRKLPYGFTDEGDLEAGLSALDHLLRSVGPEYTTPVLSQLLLAPLRRCVPKFMARPGLFVEGRTGSFKTTVVQTAMCLYGPRFLQDDALLKWGEGATRNAILSIAAFVQDLPLLVDNYKPNTGEGPKAFTNLVHNISEGTDRVRLDARAELRPSRALHCLPIYTGEDIPDNDSATLARLLLVRFPRQDGSYNAHLAAAHEAAEHLQSVGAAWLDWLEVEQNRKEAARVAQSMWADRYDFWRQIVLGAQSNVANAPRIITNLVMHDIGFYIAGLCPALHPITADYAVHHNGALQVIATSMASRTTEAVDASHFLSALRELLTSGACVLMNRQPPQEPKPDERDRMIGWRDDNGIYLLPELAVAAARRLLGTGSIPVSPQALYSQLEGLGAIAEKGSGQVTKLLKTAGKVTRVLHLKTETISGQESVNADDVGL